jgi:hypothetical protein
VRRTGSELLIQERAKAHEATLKTFLAGAAAAKKTKPRAASAKATTSDSQRARKILLIAAEHLDDMDLLRDQRRVNGELSQLTGWMLSGDKRAYALWQFLLSTNSPFAQPSE